MISFKKIPSVIIILAVLFILSLAGCAVSSDPESIDSDDIDSYEHDGEIEVEKQPETIDDSDEPVTETIEDEDDEYWIGLEEYEDEYDEYWDNIEEQFDEYDEYWDNIEEHFDEFDEHWDNFEAETVYDEYWDN